MMSCFTVICYPYLLCEIHCIKLLFVVPSFLCMHDINLHILFLIPNMSIYWRFDENVDTLS